MIPKKAKWLLTLINESGGYVEGVTRLHKYAFLSAKRIKHLTKHEFYDDWEPGNYGPFSPQLAKDIEMLIELGLLKQYEKTNEYGYKVRILELTEQGKSQIHDMQRDYKKYIKEIKKLVEPYQKKRLIDLLHDVYYLYPQYATKSNIRAKVGKKIYESDSWLNPEYD